MSLSLHTRTAITNLVRHIAGPLPVRIYIFGSQARGAAGFGSDIDVAIERVDQKPLPPGLLTEIRDALDDSNIPERVDVVDWAVVSDGFRAAASRDAIQL